MKQFIGLAIALFAMWLLWSGHYTTLLIAFGVVSCLAVVSIARRMDNLDHQGHPIRIGLRIFTYVPWLLWAIAKANIDIARRVLSPRLPIEPNIVRVKASQKTELGQALYANSITLTPGTVTLLVSDDTLTIHALTRESAADLETGEMDRRVTGAEGQS